MGKPAARLGDMTAHGGSIVGPGVPNVLIGGMPAATLGDMHVCPMVTPGVPPIPHVGGPITLGSTGVMIGKKPAARMGDMAVCVGPPSTIVLGCMTVLIGEVGSGGAGGGGGGGAGAGGGSADAASAALVSAAIAGQSPESEEHETHSIDAVFVDKTKKPVGGLNYSIDLGGGREMAGRLAGPIKRSGVGQGSYDIMLRGITSIMWSKREADVGESVDMIVETVGVKGEKAAFTVYVRDGNYTDYELGVVEKDVPGDSTKASWKLEIDEKFMKIAEKKGEKKRYSQPFFFFKVAIGDLFEQSGMLYLKDWLEIELHDDANKPIAGERVVVVSGGGVVIDDTLDSN